MQMQMAVALLTIVSLPLLLISFILFFLHFYQLYLHLLLSLTVCTSGRPLPRLSILVVVINAGQQPGTEQMPGDER